MEEKRSNVNILSKVLLEQICVLYVIYKWSLSKEISFF